MQEGESSFSAKKKNIFVIGDLVIDHTVFVQKPEGPHQKIGNENVYRRFIRLDIAGGASNTARILAVVNPGKTFLWGITGDSCWGNYRSILEQSQAIDGASYNIEFRSTQDESDAQMNTITRIIDIGKQPNFNKPNHVVRYDEYGHMHVSEEKRRSVLHNLQRTHEKYTLDAIIVNDLDMNTLTVDLVKRISDFANSQNPSIPLFVDPKRNKEKYMEVKGTVIMPNLSEWCYLVGEGEKEEWWRTHIDSKESLIQLAQLSFLYLGNFRYHIIKCDTLGTILLAPHETKRELYSIFHLKPHSTNKKDPPPQLGCGDVMIGILAFEAACSKVDTNRIIEALSKSNVVVAAYRDMFWQRMPRLIDFHEQLSKRKQPDLIAETSTGMLFMPKDSHIRLSEYETECHELISMDSIFKDSVIKLLSDIRDGWQSNLYSIVLSAGSGCGKTTLVSGLIKDHTLNLGCKVMDIIDTSITLQVNKFEEEFKTLFESGFGKKRHLIIIDEAFKGKFKKILRTNGVELLNFVHRHNIRFLFIDTPDNLKSMDDEFLSRCKKHMLPALSERPQDIPIIVPKYIFDNYPVVDIIKIDSKLLLALTDATLADPNPRSLCSKTDEIYSKYKIREELSSKIYLKFEDGPFNVGQNISLKGLTNPYYEFSR
ncbi:MAG: hypothetical protein PHP04_14520 [Bacteroidales bacterium]|nr:hypothetical protein [Bacteroidales bacterium]